MHDKEATMMEGNLIMLSWHTTLLAAWFAVGPVVTAPASPEEWMFEANYVDACSCDMACPCIFGGSPTHGYCRGATLVEILDGHYGEVDLSGVTVLAVYDGGVWIKFLVSEDASKAQTEAVVELLPIAEGFFDAPVLEVRNVPISVSRTDARVTIRAEGTLVDLVQVRSGNGGPIKVSGLPAAGFPGVPYLDHTQYRTVALTHDSGNESYEFSGSNGFTARIEVSSQGAGR